MSIFKSCFLFEIRLASTGVGVGVGGFLVLDGMSMFAFGVGKMVCGLASNNTEKEKETIKNSPNSIVDVAGIVVSEATGDKEVRNNVATVELVATTAVAPPKKIIEKTVTAMQGFLLYKDLKTQKKETTQKKEEETTQKKGNKQTNSNNDQQTNKTTDQIEKKDFLIVPLPSNP